MADSVTSQTQHLTSLDFDITKALQQLEELREKFNSITEQIAGKNWSINAVIHGDEELDNLNNQAVSVANQIKNIENEIKNFDDSVGKGFNSVNENLKNLSDGFKTAQDSSKNYKEGLDDVNDSTDGLNTTTSTLISTIEGKLVSALEQAARAGYEAVKSTEDSMVEISRVLDTTASETETLRGSLFELGNEYGRSFEDVSDVALRFAQAGYDMNDTISNTKALLLGMNTAELDASSGTTELIGIMSQWGMQADELVTIIDKLNYTADNNAVTTQDLADALLKASSMAKTAGMSFDDTVGVLTAMKVASGAAGKEVGNAFKSIIAYIQRPESLKLFDNMGIDVFADEVTGELLPMMTILENMTNKWNSSQEEMVETLVNSGDAAQLMSEEFAIATGSLDEYTQYQEAAAAATDKANDAEARAQAQAAAGVFRRNYYISLMENFANAVEISNDLVNAEGHSMEENSRYMETLTAKTEQLIVALTELAVAAADSGMLDLAKQAIDTATAFVKWTTESKNLFPILASISGLIITIKSQKLASEIQAIGGAFGNAVNAIRGVETAAAGATTAAAGLSGALGAIGLVTTVIFGVVTAVNAYKQSMEEARQETIETAEKEKERSEVLENTMNVYEELAKRYDELRSKSELTADETEELKTITEQLQTAQDNLTESYGTQAEAIDIINGKYDEQIAKLKELSEEELQYLLNTQRNAVIASKESNSQKDAASSGKYAKDEFNTIVWNGLGYGDRTEYDDGTLGDYSNSALKYSFFGDSTQIEIEATTESLEKLKDVLDEIEEAGGKNSNSWTMVYEAINSVESKLAETKDLYSELAETQFTAYNNSSEFGEIGKDNYLEWRKGLLDTANGDTELENALAEIISKKYPQYDYIADADAIKEMTDAEKAYYFKKKASTKAVEESKKAIDSSTESTKSAAGAIELTEEDIESLAKTISDSEKNITNLNKYMETLSEGNGLTAEQVMELCNTYGLLAEQFTLTEKGYTIEVSALKALQEEQKQTAVDAQLAQAGYTESVINNILKRIQAYSDEVKSISTVAEAQLALEQLKSQLSDEEAKAHINSKDDYEKYKERTADLRELITETEDYTGVLTELEALQNDLYENLGMSFDSVSDKTKETGNAAEDADKALKALIDTIERFGEMGIYSTEEVIEKFEELRRTAGYTEDQIKSIEDKLHELYTSQVEEHLKAAEQEYKDYVDKTKEKYEEDKEALKKLLDDELDMFKEQQSDELDARKEYWEDEIDKLKDSLNAQIDASKKAYEQKKKLSEKSYDNQIDALESLRDAEISNIEAAYNAQISALEKIKAARQAERDEEDYQDERNELLEQISYWEQRTGTEAVENLENLKKQLADLDKEHQRDLEDKDIDDQISSLEDQRDSETAALKAQYDAQIAALKSAKETELEIYESTYNAEQELLKAKLEKDVKAMEDARDADLKALQKKQKEDLKLLEEEHEKKLKDLEDEKDAAIKAAEEKWKEIEKIFTDSNIAMIASAGMFASDLYKQFNTLFTQNFKMDLEEIRRLIAELNAQKSTMESASGKTPSSNSSGSSGSSGSSSKKKNKPVQANTGGKTTADGLVMLHKNELIINPPTTKKLEDLIEQLAMPKSDIIIDPKIMKRINKMAEFYHSPGGNNYNTNNNSYNNSYNNSRPIVQNFNAPLQNIEKIEDSADLEAATNALERKIMRELSTKL